MVKTKYKPNFPILVCKDGCKLSVQASDTHYSTPREDRPDVPYTHIEIGFPQGAIPESWREYAESHYSDNPDPNDTVYPYLPIELLDEYITLHGGLDYGHTLRQAGW